VIIKTQKVDPRTEGRARILIKESDRDVSSLEKSSTDISVHCQTSTPFDTCDKWPFKCGKLCF
jgi:hypothetical protein